MNSLKQHLYDLCMLHINNNISEIEAAIADRRDAIANETKSSMGDKYETTREMLQQDINMNLERLSKAKSDEAALNLINKYMNSTVIIPGSLVHTNNGSFFISISAGQLFVDGTKYYAVSAASPIGVQLKGKQQGDTFTLNGKHFVIESVD